MKRIILLTTLLLCTTVIYGQEQTGIVKTIGRPGRPGAPIENVLIRAKGNNIASASDHLGVFSIVLADLSPGDIYSIIRIYKDGYQLADSDILGRPFPFAPNIPLEISMISKEEYLQTVSDIEKDIRKKVEQEYQNKLTDLNNKIAAQNISEELYKQEYQILQDYYDNSEVLITKLADRYARTDYDKLDSLGIKINTYIEEGNLDEAEKLILSKGTIDERKQKIKIQEENNRLLEKTLNKSKDLTEKLKADLAQDLYTRFDIALMRFDNKEAAKYLKERMLIDTLKIQWAIDYADFIRDYLGSYEEAMDIYNSLISNNINNSYISEIQYRIGNTFYLKGNYESAIDNYQISINHFEGDSLINPLMAETYHNMANIFLEQDKFDEGLHYLSKSEELYSILKDTLGLSSIYNTHGVLYSTYGNFDFAEKFFRKALDIRIKYYGETNTNTASCYSNIAKLLYELNKYEEAYNFYIKTLEIDSTILGNNHPKIAKHKLDIGTLLISLNKYDNTLMLFTEALKIYKDFYGEYHPSIITAYNHLGRYYCNIEVDYTKAIDYYSKSKILAERIYGHNHSMVANALQNIAFVHMEMSNLTKAIDFYNESAEITKKIYGEQHYLMADIYNNLAEIYFRLEEYNIAKEYFEKCLKIDILYYGEKHSKVALNYNNLAAINEKIGNEKIALEFYKKSLYIYIELYGEKHLTVSSIYNNLGCLLLTQHKLDSAEKYLLKNLQITKEIIQDENHPDIAKAYNNLSSLYIELDNYEKAEEYINKSIEIKRNLYGDFSPSMATTYANASVTYYYIENYDKAIEYSRKALDLVGQIYPPSHSIVLLYTYGLGEILYKSKKYEESLPYFQTLYQHSINNNELNTSTAKLYFNTLHLIYFQIMGESSYDGRLDKSFMNINNNSVICGTVSKNSYAEEIGLSGEYIILSLNEWDIADKQSNYFVYSSQLAPNIDKTYILFKDGKITSVTFNGKLGININPKFIDQTTKKSIIKVYKRWKKRNK